MTWLLQLVGRWVEQRRVRVLRAALGDAILHCPRCVGQGFLLLPGGCFSCPICG